MGLSCSSYVVFMIILLVAELVVGGLAFFYKDKARSHTKEFLQSTIRDFYSTPEQMDVVTLMWNNMMVNFSCCGVNDYRDFDASSSWTANKGNRTVPETCCILKEGEYLPRDNDCVTNPSESNSYYKKGCYDVLVDQIIAHREIIIGMLLGIGIVQLFTIFLAIVLYKAFTKYHGMRL